jgi:uncharacterized membrane protein
MLEYPREKQLYCMDNKKKRMFLIIGIVEVVVLIFCLVISILVLHNLSNDDKQANLDNNGVFIGTLQNNPTLFLLTIVLPVFIIFVVDGVYLIVYANKKESVIGDEEKAAIEEEAKRQAREEVLKELQAEQNKSDENKKPAETKAPDEKK